MLQWYQEIIASLTELNASEDISLRGRTVKTIGLIGGMSWESSIEYYRIINETAKARLGGLHSAKSIMYSVDFAEIEVLQHQGRWQEAAQVLIGAAKSVENGGADFIVLCTNTMHKVAGEIQAHINIPILHIADATAQKIKAVGLKRIGLLGTRFTMEHDFYKGRLIDQHGLDVIIPDLEECEAVHRVIYDELCLGIARPQSRENYIRIMGELVQAGAEGIILGCTEIELLVHEGDSPVPLFPTAKIHAIAAVEYALAQEFSAA
jgi:aspartate racemase